MDKMIRKAREKDCDDVYALICEMREEQLDYYAFSMIYKVQLRDKSYAHFVCEQNGETVGVLVLRLEYQLHHAARVAEITELAVKSGFRSQGIGGELFAAAKKYSASNNAVILEVASGKARTDAHRFYEKNGMTLSHFKLSVSLDGAGRRV